ncbi:MAG: tyrosine-type recombinase/integrase [Pseudolabrys sp.]
MSVRKRTWTTRKGEQKESWIVDYVDQGGARHIQTFERKKDADDYHAKVKVDVHKGMHTAPSKSITVAEAGEAWIKRVEAEGRERGTLLQYRQHVSLHIVPRIGRWKLSSLTHQTIEKFRDDLLADTSRPMAKKALTSLKSILRNSKFAHVADDVRIKRNKRDERKLEVGRDIPTPGEIKRLIEAAKPGKQRAMLLVAATCGLRASEIRGLRWSDVNLKEATLKVMQRADRFGGIGAPKSVSSRREIPLAPEAVAELREWKLACPKADLDLVFPAGGGKIAAQVMVARSVEAVMHKAKVLDKHGEPKYSLHSFRHFFASWCLNRRSEGGRELPPKQVQSLLGHSSIVMTMDVYGHLFPRSSDRTELAQATSALLT